MRHHHKQKFSGTDEGDRTIDGFYCSDMTTRLADLQ